MMRLIKFKHNADEQYKIQAEEFKDKNIDFYTCYRNLHQDCVDCESTFKVTFSSILSNIKIDPTWNFMDCGSGLGIPLYVASNYFNKVYGVEILSELVDICNKNLKILNINNYELINNDINSININILDSINVFYLYNPFQNDIFKKFISNVVESIKRCEREVWLIYLNTIHEDLFNDELIKKILPLDFSVNDFQKINYYHHNIKNSNYN